MKQEIVLDSSIRDWVLFPIMIVMILVGVLRHYATILLSSQPKVDLKGIREAQALLRGRLLRSPAASYIPAQAFNLRKSFLSTAFEKGDYLKKKPDGTNSSSQPPNPLSDPAGMEAMMEGMKKNMAMIVPQTLIMSWITFFFSGFVLIRLPFPLTLKFKAMLQRGIETSEMDVTWVSSLSWYFLNLFGLRSIYTLILGEENSADGVSGMTQMQMNPMGSNPQQDMSKVFQSEKEFLDIAQHESFLDNVEKRLLAKYGYL